MLSVLLTAAATDSELFLGPHKNNLRSLRQFQETQRHRELLYVSLLTVIERHFMKFLRHSGKRLWLAHDLFFCKTKRASLVFLVDI
jgi:hypothetical protein